jgi:hypothetical protein
VPPSVHRATDENFSRGTRRLPNRGSLGAPR